MRRIPLVAARQHGVFTCPQALADGWTRHALDHAVRHGYLVRLRPGVYAVPIVDTGDRHQLELARLIRAGFALGLTHRRLTLSHRTAAAIDELPLLTTTTTPCVTFARPFRGEIRGAHLHRAFLWTGDILRRDLILRTSVPRSVVDIGRELGADDCVVVADAALRRGLTTTARLDEVLDRCAGWPGIRRAAHAVAHADPRAESPLESVSRLRIVDAGLPAPWPQPTIHANGTFAGRVDFYWDEFGVVGECDGLAKYDEPHSLRDEKRRQGPMEDAGLIFVRWGWSDLSDFEAVVHRLRAAFERALRPDRAPRQWTATPCLLPRMTGELISVGGQVG